MSMRMTVEEALKQPGRLLGVWDIGGTPAGVLVYVLPEAGERLRLLAHEDRAEEAKDATLGAIRSSGARVAYSFAANEFIWSPEQGFSAWSSSGEEVFRGDDRELRLQDGRVIPKSQVTRVVSFFDEDHWGHRGIQLELRDGSTAVAIEERDRAAEIDPTYGIDYVMIDAAWGTFLGRHLAEWLGVPHRDDLP
jgi:hypothetical protein